MILKGETVIRNDELTRILERVVEIGLRGGWAQFEDTPLPLPLIQLAPPRSNSTKEDDSSRDGSSPDPSDNSESSS